jgi:transcriptional regulator with XRE-family HTH domain
MDIHVLHCCLQDVGGRFMYPNLKLKLWSMGIRQNQLAKTLGIDETMLSKLINGFREPSPEMRAKIANALNADESWLFERVQSARTRT